MSARTRTGRATAVVLAAVTLASGCGLGVEPPAALPPVPSEVTSGGALRIGIVVPTSLDPAQAYDRDGELVVRAMCDPLVEIDPETGRAHAGLLKHIVPESEGSGVTLTLKDDLRFSDGTDVVAQDVRASLSRVASDTLASPLADELRPLAGFGKVHGDVPVKDEDDLSRTLLDGVTQVTKKVVTVTLADPDSQYVHRLSRPWAATVPAARADRSEFAQQPVCVGPYRLAEPWTGGQTEIRLVRSKSYHGRNEAYTGGGRGYPDEIVFKTYPTTEAAYAGFVKGEVQVARVPAAAAAAAGAAGAPGSVTRAPTPSLEYVGLPNSQAPFTDPRVRLALSLALDRTSLLAELKRPDRVLASSLLPTTLPAEVVQLPACTALAPPKADVARARALLAEAGVSLDGVTVPFYVNDEKGSGNKELVAAVAAQWKAALGLVPKLVPLPWEEYRERGRTGAGFDGPFRTSWSSPVSSVSAFVEPLFLSGAIGRSNLARFSDVELDREYERSVVTETDDAVRAGWQRKLMTRVCEQAPLVPVWGGTQAFAVRDDVASASGELQRAVDGTLNVRELYLRRP